MKQSIFLFFLCFSFVSISQEHDKPEFYWLQADSIIDTDPRLAEEYLSKAIELKKFDDVWAWESFYNLRGIAKRNQGYYNKAILDFNRAIEIDSTDAESYYEKAVALYYQEENHAAIKILDIAKKFGHSKGAIALQKSEIFEELGEYEKANIELNYVLSTWDEWNYSDEYKVSIIANIESNKSLSKKSNYNRTLGYYPYTFLSYKDTLSYPIEVKVKLDIFSIEGLDIKDNFFKAEYSAGFFSKYPDYYVTRIIEERFGFEEPDTLRITDVSEYLYVDSIDEKIRNDYNGFWDEYDWHQFVTNRTKSNFSHIWDLRDFPFDKQKLRIEVIAEIDSSIVSLERWDDPAISKNVNEIRGLQDGQIVEIINFKKEYIRSNYSTTFSPNNTRGLIYPVGVFEIIVSRDGSLLFIKLFLGIFLAFLMSLSSFIINKRNFPSRIDVSVGALFIAVGNKYFVESVTPVVQILTKADIINNIGLLLIILNVFFIIGQHKPNIKLGKFEDSKFTFKFSSFLFATLVIITILF